jgi:hypothetical protein
LGVVGWRGRRGQLRRPFVCAFSTTHSEHSSRGRMPGLVCCAGWGLRTDKIGVDKIGVGSPSSWE